MKYLYISAGWLSLVCGLLGIVLPVLPTTPFVLLSAACFARGSSRFHGWLVNHRYFGPLITSYHELGVSPRIKAAAIGCATLSIGLSGLAVDATTLRLLLLLLWLIGIAVILRLPHRPFGKQ